MMPDNPFIDLIMALEDRLKDQGHRVADFDTVARDELAVRAAPETAKHLLQGFLDVGPSLLPAGASHRHANGFAKLSLYRSRESRFTVRLHIWEGIGSDSSIHDHRWHF